MRVVVNTKLKKLISEPTDRCIEWIGCYFNHGYGRVRFRKKVTTAHRVAFYLAYDWLPVSVDHLCRNIKCVNPKHLEGVTDKENILRGFSPSAINARKTHCIEGHELSGKNIYRKSALRGIRRCRICARKQWQKPGKTQSVKLQKV